MPPERADFVRYMDDVSLNTLVNALLPRSLNPGQLTDFTEINIVNF